MKRIINGFTTMFFALIISTAYVAALIVPYTIYESTKNPWYLSTYVLNFIFTAHMLGRDE